MNNKPITIIALIILGLCLLGKFSMQGNKNVDMGCNIILFIAIVLLAVNQLLVHKERFEQLKDNNNLLNNETTAGTTNTSEQEQMPWPLPYMWTPGEWTNLVPYNNTTKLGWRYPNGMPYGVGQRVWNDVPYPSDTWWQLPPPEIPSGYDYHYEIYLCGGGGASRANFSFLEGVGGGGGFLYGLFKKNYRPWIGAFLSTDDAHSDLAYWKVASSDNKDRNWLSVSWGQGAHDTEASKTILNGNGGYVSVEANHQGNSDKFPAFLNSDGTTTGQQLYAYSKKAGKQLSPTLPPPKATPQQGWDAGELGGATVYTVDINGESQPAGALKDVPGCASVKQTTDTIPLCNQGDIGAVDPTTGIMWGYGGNALTASNSNFGSGGFWYRVYTKERDKCDNFNSKCNIIHEIACFKKGNSANLTISNGYYLTMAPELVIMIGGDISLHSNERYAVWSKTRPEESYSITSEISGDKYYLKCNGMYLTYSNGSALSKSHLDTGRYYAIWMKTSITNEKQLISFPTELPNPVTTTIGNSPYSFSYNSGNKNFQWIEKSIHDGIEYFAVWSKFPADKTVDIALADNITLNNCKATCTDNNCNYNGKNYCCKSETLSLVSKDVVCKTCNANNKGTYCKSTDNTVMCCNGTSWAEGDPLHCMTQKPPN